MRCVPRLVLRAGLVASALACVLMVATAAAGAEPPTGTQTTAGQPTTPTGTDDGTTDAASPAVPAFGDTTGLVPWRPVPEPVSAGSGVDALVRLPDLRGDNAPTLRERYGAGGYTLDTDLWSADGTDRAVNALAGALFAFITWIAAAVTALVHWAFSLDVTAPLRTAVVGLVDALRGALYTPFVVAAVVLAGGYGLWHGMVRHHGTLAAQGLVWSLAALIAGGVFLVHPGALVDTATTASVEVSRAVLAGVAVVDPKPSVAGATFAGDPTDAELRVTGDRLWRVFVHQPWLVAQFGDLEAGERYGEALLAAKTYSAEETDRLRADPAAATELAATKRDAYVALRDELREQNPGAYAWFSGRRATERVGVATFALLAIVGLGGMLALVAGAVVVAQLAFLLLVVAAPAFLLLGIHPGTGRILALRWAELLGGVLVKRVLYSALLAVLLVLGGVLLDATAGLGWAAAVMLQTLLVATAVVHRRAFVRLLSGATAPAARATAPSVARASTPAVHVARPGPRGGGPAPVARPVRTRATPHPPVGTGHPNPVTAAVAATARRKARLRIGPLSVRPDAATSNGNGNGHRGGAADLPDPPVPDPGRGQQDR